MKACDACIDGRHVRCRRPCDCSVCARNTGGARIRSRSTPVAHPAFDGEKWHATSYKPKSGPRPASPREEQEIREAVLKIAEAVVERHQAEVPRQSHHCSACGQPL